MSHRLQARLFGALAVCVDDVPVKLGGPRQRALMAVLLMEPGRPIPPQRLVELVWGDAAPPSAMDALYVYVSRLRKNLGPAGSDLRRESDGYVLDVPADSVDALRFDATVQGVLDRQSSIEPEQLVTMLGSALGEWRGSVLEGCAANELWLELHRAHLDRRRDAAIEALADGLLQLGRHETAVRLLDEAVAAQPDREGLVAKLMIGLYRAGRQADALSAYLKCRSWLRDELGIEPSETLADLYVAILEQRPDLQWCPPQRRAARRMLPLRNPRFFGRSSVVATVGARLERSRIVALHGIGGAGKSVVALEVAHRHQGFAGWINAENSAAVLGSLAAIAADRGIDTSSGRHQGMMLRDLWRDLANEQTPLLVFDNAPDPEAIHPYLPSIDHAQVLVTSRSAGWGAVGVDLQVGPFTAEEATAYLLDRTGSTDRESAVELAEDLGRLPLACAQAAAFVEQSGVSLREYRDLYTQRRSELLFRAAPDGYGQTVGTTWQLAFQALESGAPQAALLLETMSFLSPNQVSDRLVQGLFADSDPLALADAVRDLRRFSLVDREGGATLAVHPLVQSVVRSRLPAATWRDRFDLTVRLLLDADSGDPCDPRHWPSWSALAPHVLVLAGHATEVDRPPPQLVELIRRATTYLHHQGSFLAARDAMVAAVELAERGGIDRRTVGAMHSELGDLHDANGNVRAARDEHARALEMLESELDPGDERIVLARARFGHLLHCLGQTQRAVQLMTEALAVIRKHPGRRSHIRVCVDLGYAQWAAGAHAEAQKAFEEALRALADQPPQANRDLYAEAVGGLGIVRQDLGHLDEACRLIERSVTTLRNLYPGEDHPALAQALDKYGYVLRLLGRIAQSIGAHQEAERMLTATIGESDPRTAMALTNLGLAHRDGGDLASAADAQRRAHRLLLNTHGPDHPHTRMVAERLDDLAEAIR